MFTYPLKWFARTRTLNQYAGFLNHYGFIPRSLPRVPSFQRTPESRNRTGCPRLTTCRGRLIKSGMTQNTPLLAAG